MAKHEQWLAVITQDVAPPGIGTLAASERGVFVETLDPTDWGRWYSWQEVVDCLLAHAPPATEKE